MYWTGGPVKEANDRSAEQDTGGWSAGPEAGGWSAGTKAGDWSGSGLSSSHWLRIRLTSGGR